MKKEKNRVYTKLLTLPSRDGGSAAGQLNVLNGIGNTANYASAIWGNSQAYAANAAIYRGTTVGQYFAANSGTAAVAQAQGHDVYIDSGWINGMPLTSMMALLVHELTHNITGNVDPVLQAQLNTVLPADQQLKVGAASENVSNQIQKDCFK